VAHAQGAAYADADAPVVFNSEPTLVEVDTGIWVVRDYDYPVYFYEDNYWVFRDGVWYRSNSYQGGWVRIEATVVPTVIVHRDHRSFVHYHGAATAQVRLRREGRRTRSPPGPAPSTPPNNTGGPPVTTRRTRPVMIKPKSIASTPKSITSTPKSTPPPRAHHEETDPGKGKKARREEGRQERPQALGPSVVTSPGEPLAGDSLHAVGLPRSPSGRTSDPTKSACS